MRIVSLFTGVAGLDLAVEHVTGGRVVAHAEVDPTACKILDHHYPDTPNLGDATTIDWQPWAGRVDAICAGFSCQDISQAGAGKGITDDTRSGVTWGATIRAVRALRPRHVYLENVSAILARGLTTVASDLAAAGYDLRWACVRASDVGAPHRRDRWFAVAYPDGGGSEAAGGSHEGRQPDVAARGRAPVAYPEGEQVGGTGLARPHTGRVVAYPDGGSVAGEQSWRAAANGDRPAATDAGRDGLAGSSQPDSRTQRPGLEPPRRADPDRCRDVAADADGAGPQGHGRPVGGAGELAAATSHRPAPADAAGAGRRPRRTSQAVHEPRPVERPARPDRVAWGDYKPAITRWATILGRPAPPPTDTAGRLNPDFVEWMVGLPQGWTDIDGATRTGRLRCLGNIAVPQQAAAAYGMLLADVLTARAA